MFTERNVKRNDRNYWIGATTMSIESGWNGADYITIQYTVLKLNDLPKLRALLNSGWNNFSNV